MLPWFRYKPVFQNACENYLPLLQTHYQCNGHPENTFCNDLWHTSFHNLIVLFLCAPSGIKYYALSTISLTHWGNTQSYTHMHARTHARAHTHTRIQCVRGKVYKAKRHQSNSSYSKWAEVINCYSHFECKLMEQFVVFHFLSCSLMQCAECYQQIWAFPWVLGFLIKTIKSACVYSHVDVFIS